MIGTLVLLAWVLGLQGQPDFVLEKGRAGRARPGMSIDDLYQAYGGKNMKLVDLFGEGMFQPAIEIYMDGAKALVAEVTARKGFVVGRIMVYDKRFRTTDGIGIGSTLDELRKRHAVKILSGEGGMPVAWDESLGISFFLDGPPLGKRSAVPGGAKIAWVMVVE
jgi:hypothetical protein